MQSFHQLFRLLNTCFFTPGDHDEALGAFLGMISPDLWADGLPADMAILRDWIKLHGEAPMDEATLRRAAVDFLRSLGFDFTHTIAWLQNQ